MNERHSEPPEVGEVDFTLALRFAIMKDARAACGIRKAFFAGTLEGNHEIPLHKGDTRYETDYEAMGDAVTPRICFL